MFSGWRRLASCPFCWRAAQASPKSGLGPVEPSPISIITLSPDTAILATGGSITFSATALHQDGSSSTPQVAWSATGGTVSGTGFYAAGATPGNYRVIAVEQTDSLADTSVVVISLTPPVLQAVILTPATASVAAGAQQQFSVAGQWSDGSTTAPAVSYAATGGTVNANGRYTAGTTAGSFRVIATQQGGSLADTSTVTVTASPSGVLFSDDFESGLGQWEDVTQVHIGTAQAHSGTKSLELSYAAGSEDAGWAWRKRLVPDQAAPHDQYVRWWQRWSAGFTFYNGNGSDQKLMMLEGLSPQSGWAQTANWKIYLHVVGRTVSSISGTTLYPERFIWDGTSQWSGQWQGYLPTTQIPYAADRWICTEVQVKHNTPGQPDGELRVWIDGALMTQRTGVKFRDAAVSWNAIEISGYYDGGSPKAQTSWVDDVVVSTQRIGC